MCIFCFFQNTHKLTRRLSPLPHTHTVGPNLVSFLPSLLSSLSISLSPLSFPLFSFFSLLFTSFFLRFPPLFPFLSFSFYCFSSSSKLFHFPHTFHLPLNILHKGFSPHSFLVLALFYRYPLHHSLISLLLTISHKESLLSLSCHSLSLLTHSPHSPPP